MHTIQSSMKSQTLGRKKLFKHSFGYIWSSENCSALQTKYLQKLYAESAFDIFSAFVCHANVINIV